MSKLVKQTENELKIIIENIPKITLINMTIFV